MRDAKDVALLDAAGRGDLPAIGALLAQGARVAGLSVATGEGGRTPLEEAAFHGHLGAVRALLEARANPSFPVGDAKTSLQFAAKNGHVDVAKALVEAGADPGVQDEQADTPLHAAAEKGHVGVVRALLDARADPNAGNTWELTPLHDAAAETHLGVVRALLEARADPNKKTTVGSTPLILFSDASSYADGEFNPDMVELLLLWGADPGPKNNLGHISRDTLIAVSPGVGTDFDAAVARARGLFWTRRLHPRLPPPSRTTVAVVLHCARRIATGPAEHGSGSTLALPAMPTEVWLLILSFTRAVDLVPTRPA